MITKEELIKKKISAISLGCDKNKVDLEHMLFALQTYGFELTSNNENCDILIVNTCAFIATAINEALENLNYALTLKQSGKVEKVIVSGCLPQRNLDLLKEAYPEVDYFLTLKENENIASIIEDLYNVECSNFKSDLTGRIITNSGKYAYLKIAEGCSNGCAYCTIPSIRGRFRSVPMKELLKEAKSLANRGYKELILVAQDTAKYGFDIYNESKLLDLLKELAKIKGIEWIRLMYVYPEWVTTELLDFINTESKMCKYLDMPLQHIDNKILSDMNRKTNEEKSRALVDLINEQYPEITLRSTFIVGFPGETKKQFQKLCDFISSGKIHYATFFKYFREEKTKAYFMPKQVFEFVKNKRLKKIEAIQNVVFNAQNNAKIGQEIDVLIDEFDENQNVFIGHSKKNAPKIDFCVIIEKATTNSLVEIGKIYKIKLKEITEIGFKGEIV